LGIQFCNRGKGRDRFLILPSLLMRTRHCRTGHRKNARLVRVKIRTFKEGMDCSRQLSREGFETSPSHMVVSTFEIERDAKSGLRWTCHRPVVGLKKGNSIESRQFNRVKRATEIYEGRVIACLRKGDDAANKQAMRSKIVRPGDSTVQRK